MSAPVQTAVHVDPIMGQVDTAELLAALAWVTPFVQRQGAESRPYLGCVRLRVLPDNLLRLETCNAFQLARAHVAYNGDRWVAPAQRGEYLLQPHLLTPELFFGIADKKLWTLSLPFVLAASGPNGSVELGNAVLEGQPGTYPNTDLIMPHTEPAFTLHDVDLLARAAKTAIAADAEVLTLELWDDKLVIRMAGQGARGDLVWSPGDEGYTSDNPAAVAAATGARCAAYPAAQLLALCRARTRAAKLLHQPPGHLTFRWPVKHPQDRSATLVASPFGDHVIMPKLL